MLPASSAHRRLAVDLDDQPARADVMIADQLSGIGKKGAQWSGVNSASTQKSPLNSPSITTPPVRRSDPENVRQNVHRRPRMASVCGVSINFIRQASHFGK